jgi:O-antigen ligase
VTQDDRREGGAVPGTDHREPEQGTAHEPPAPEPILGEPGAPESILGARTESRPILTQTRQRIAARAARSEGPLAFFELLRTGDRHAAGESLARTARLVLATGLFLVPVVFDPRTLDSFNLAKLTVLWVFGVVAGAAWLYATHLTGERRSVIRSPITRASLVLLVVALLATLASPNKVLSFFGLYHRYEGFVSIALYVLVLLLLVALYRGRAGALREIAVALGASAGVVAAYVILQKTGADVTNWRLPDGNPPPFPIGSLGNSAFTASYLGITAPFVVYLVIASAGVRRLVWGAVGLLAVLALWFTSGRAGMIGAAAGVLVLLLFTSRIAAGRKIFVVFVTLLVLALAPILAGDVTDPAQSGVLRTATAGYRAEVWEASWRMFRERPFLGWGPESFFGAYPEFRTPGEARRQGLVIPDKPHNIYLGWATATGVVGFGTFIVLAGLALVLLARRSLGMTRPRRLLAAAFAAGLVAYLAQGIYSVDVPPLALLFWIALAGAVVLTGGKQASPRPEGAAEPETDDELLEEEPHKPSALDRIADNEWTRQRPWAVPTVVGVVALVLVFLGMRPLRADHAAWSGERRAAVGWSTGTMALYDKAIQLNPREAAYRGLAGAYLERVANDPRAPFSPQAALRRSSGFYLEALEIQPRNIYFMINVARVNANLGKLGSVDSFKLGDRWLGRAAAIDPLDDKMHDLYADLLRKWAAELRGRPRRLTLQRANAQAAIAKALRAGQVLP